METAHQPLVGLIYKNHLPGRLLRWALALQEYNFTLTYCKGEHNTIADNLSQTEHIQATQFTSSDLSFPLHMDAMATAQLQDDRIKHIISHALPRALSLHRYDDGCIG